MPIGEAQRQELERRGFFFTAPLFSPAELEPVRAECWRLWQASLAENADPRQAEMQRVRPFLPGLHRRSALLARFNRHPVFCELAGALVGPEVDQTWSQACLKLPDVDALTAFPYHQDGQFAAIDHQATGLSCFLALGPLSVDNGTLLFAAGAHHGRLAHRRDERLNWWSCDVDGLDVVPGVLEPGQMVVYRTMTPHGSPPNRTATPREAYLVTFNVPGVRLLETGELFGDQRPLLRNGRPVGD